MREGGRFFDPRRKGIDQGPRPVSSTPPPQEAVELRRGFRIVATGEDTLLSWMKLKRSMASDPHIPSDPLEDDLKLGVVPMGDGSSILGAGISYDPDDNEYKLEGQIISRKQGTSPIVAGPPGMIGIDFGRMFGGQEESERGEKISLPNIERDLTAQGFEVEYANG